MQNEKILNTAVILDIDSKLREHLDTLINIQDKIKKILLPMDDGKKLRGNDIVGLLGEIYAVKMLSGKLLPDGKEADIDVPDCKMRVSVKARKETSDKNSWKQTSDIHKIEDSDCTHLIFLKFDKEYRVANVWLYPWEVVEKRAEEHNSRGNKMGYIFRVNPKEDEKYLRYTDGKQKFENKSKDKEKPKEDKQIGSLHSKSATGKYESIRALMEELLLANYDKNSLKPTISYDEIKKIVLSEFPTSRFNKKHLSWYVNKILKNGEFINA